MMISIRFVFLWLLLTLSFASSVLVDLADATVSLNEGDATRGHSRGSGRSRGPRDIGGSCRIPGKQRTELVDAPDDKTGTFKDGNGEVKEVRAKVYRKGKFGDGNDELGEFSMVSQAPLYKVVGQGDCDWHYTSKGSIGVTACGTACDAEALCEKFTYGSTLGCRISKCGTNSGGTSCLNGQCPLASMYGGSVYSMDVPHVGSTTCTASTICCSQCCALKSDYGVVPGSHWGSLSDEGQRQWFRENCQLGMGFWKTGWSHTGCPCTPPPPPPEVPTQAPTRVPHLGFADASWWNATLWRQLDAQTPRVDCNPARCSNVAECGIPNCTIVNFNRWYWHGHRHRNPNVCNTVARQTGTGANDCVPSDQRYDWPTNASPLASEGAVCRTTLGVANLNINRIMDTWHLLPATRMAFCQSNHYITTYTTITPSLEPVTAGLTLGSWIWANKIFNVEAGGWKVSTRGYFAWPFTTFSLPDGTSTKNIGLFIFKRAICKQSTSGGSDCYSLMTSHCFTTPTNFATTRYPSEVGSGQLGWLRHAVFTGSASECNEALEEKIEENLEAFLAAQ